jgi:hypothetical protein
VKNEPWAKEESGILGKIPDTIPRARCVPDENISLHR